MAKKSDGPPLDAIMLPREEPISPLAVKRAMLLYDSVWLPDPSETHLIPSDVIVDKYPHLTVSMNEFGPYPRTTDYRDSMERLADQCRRLISRDIVRIVNTDEQSASSFRLIRHAYHWLAGDKELLESAVVGLRSSSALKQIVLEDGVYYGMSVVPKGYPDPYGPYPKPQVLEAGSSEEARRLTWIACLRVGLVVKYLLFAERHEAIPLALDGSQSAVIDHLYRRSLVPDSSLHDVLPSFGVTFPMEEGIGSFIFDEVVDADCLDQMTMRDVERIRSRAWGGLQGVRRRLRFEMNRAQHELIDASPAELSAFVSGKLHEMLHDYRQAQMEFYDALKSMGISLVLKGLASLSASATVATILKTTGWGGLVLLAVGMVPTVVGLSADRLADMWKKEKALHRLPMYALMKGIPGSIR